MIGAFNIFVNSGGGFLIPYKDKLMLFLIQQICQRGWRMLISYEDKWVRLPPFYIFVIAGAGFLMIFDPL